MANSSIQNWIIWPLEIIDKTLYKCDERKKEIINFRRISSNRENEWIKIFKSMQPRGFNITYPKKQLKNRRYQRRPNNVEEDSHYDMPCRSCVETTENGEISIHTHRGRHESIRRTLNELLLLPTNDDSYHTAINRLSHHQKCNPG
jgi:hypothetical protein